jgi:hypothetical protein
MLRKKTNGKKIRLFIGVLTLIALMLNAVSMVNAATVVENFNGATIDNIIAPTYRTAFDLVGSPTDGGDTIADVNNKCYKYTTAAKSAGGLSATTSNAMRINLGNTASGEKVRGEIVAEYKIRYEGSQTSAASIRIGDIRGYTNTSANLTYSSLLLTTSATGSTTCNIKATAINPADNQKVDVTTSSLAFKTFHKVKLSINTETDRISIWINDVLKIDNYLMGTANNTPLTASTIGDIYLYSTNTGSGLWCVDDVNVTVNGEIITKSILDGNLTATPITSLSQLSGTDKRVKYSVDVNNNTGTTKPYTIITALYKDGRLDKVGYNTIQALDKFTHTNVMLDLSVGTLTGSGYKAKFFLFNNLDSLTPLSATTEILQ